MFRNALLLVSRLLLAALFVPSGFHALGDIAGTSGYFAGLGLPLPTLAAWATGLFELIAGLLILVGLQTPIVALLLAAFCIAAGFIGHYGQGGHDPTLAFMHQQMLMKDIALSGGFLALAMAGAGAWSVDGRILRIGPETT
ncbi:DoxX family protein [Mesorhizobium sp.]|uniref:DoxX family protein n=1 Tax=Mesorhizobium sp. TaxID=1871066 RepID=UPI000FE88B22|nr:DoxX family protein [Mesorhizobium sp.]RWE81964.1 MAG: DoxX family protein [Mesorhizobium sp.]TIS62555.1 MAG: DoxX family protein [Mesorhizobium sp.]